MAYVKCNQSMIKEGTVSGYSAGDDVYISCGFKPKKIFIYARDSANAFYVLAYDSAMSSSDQIYGWKTSSSSSGAGSATVSGSTGRGNINAITSNGFYFNFGGLSTYRYVAIG